MTAYEELKRTRGRRNRRLGLDPAVAKERASEQARRYMEARRRATLVLADRHKDEFLELMLEERAAIDAARGPLPGEEPSRAVQRATS